MPDSRTRLALGIVFLLTALAIVLFSSLRAGPGQSEPTLEAQQVATEAVATFAEGLTRTAVAEPTQTPSNTATAVPATEAVGTGSGTPDCLALHFVRDVTIPDNTEVTPAQVFTKSWVVTNSGTCPWQPGFQVVLIGGVAMGGSPFKLTQTIGPAGSIQVSIKMAAPTNQTGVVQGTWKMADANGQVFGDYLSVVVVVKGPGGSPVAPSQAPPSVTATP